MNEPKQSVRSKLRKTAASPRYGVCRHANLGQPLCVDRTRLSADSTLMGWMRLATTLIGFGFTIVQFFYRLENMSGAKPALAPPCHVIWG